jgi:tetratricopeptide (TPR) repeat protein
MPASLTSNEEAQLSQTIEMFEVITQSQPLDYQSLEILKEAYSKLGRQKETVRTSKRIAEAYLHLGQLSSAILEYESVLQGFPDDPDVLAALAQIELKASNVAAPNPLESEEKPALSAPQAAKSSEKHASPAQIDDGRQQMQKIFVDGKQLSATDFNTHWPVVDPHSAPKQALEPFIQILADRQLLPLDVSLKLLLEKSRLSYLPIERYDVDVELARGFPRDICRRWCILPFDRMSKSILVATANPYNQQAIHDLHAFTKSRLLWYLAAPGDLLKALAKTYR